MIYVSSMKPHPWKVPFRAVYSETFWQWVRSTLRCHVYLKLFSKTVNCTSAEALPDGPC